MLEQFPLVICDFQEVYGIELETWHGTWRRFQTRLAGLLLTPNSRIWRHFQSDD